MLLLLWQPQYVPASAQQPAIETAWQPADPSPTLPQVSQLFRFSQGFSLPEVDFPPTPYTYQPYEVPGLYQYDKSHWILLPVPGGAAGYSLAQPPPFGVPAPSLPTVLEAWIPPDSAPTLTVQWAGRPGWSVNNPPRTHPPSTPWPPDPDPLPQLGARWMGRPGWSIDNPLPYAKKSIDIQAPWWAAIPPDPNPTLTVQWMGRPGWSVDVPPRWRAPPLPPPPDPDPLQKRQLTAPPPVAVAYVPFAEVWLGTVIASWQPPDPQPTLERNLNPQLTAVPVNNPPFQVSGLLGNVTAWLPGDPQPTVPRYGPIPQPVAFVQPFSGNPWVSAVLAAWAIVDPLPVSPRGWMGRPGWSVDPPPLRLRGADAVPFPQPPDPPPTLPLRFTGQPGWSVDPPPRYRVLLPPDPVADPLPTLPRPGVPPAPARVDNPPIILTGLWGNIWDWIVPDPLPTLIRLGPVLPPVIIVTPPAPLGELGIFVHGPVSFYCGDDWIIYGALTDELGNPFDPTTSSSITWKLDDETGTINYFTLTLGSGISFVSVPNSSVPGIVIVLPALSSSTLVPQTYRNQLRVVIGGVTSTFWQGSIQAMQQLI